MEVVASVCAANSDITGSWGGSLTTAGGLACGRISSEVSGLLFVSAVVKFSSIGFKFGIVTSPRGFCSTIPSCSFVLLTVSSSREYLFPKSISRSSFKKYLCPPGERSELILPFLSQRRSVSIETPRYSDDSPIDNILLVLPWLSMGIIQSSKLKNQNYNLKLRRFYNWYLLLTFNF